MSKNTLLSNLINYISANSSGNVVVAAPTSGFALDVTGTGRFTGALTLGSTITNGTFTYTLPSATGTLALTSALSAYLPLSGGTLTGALSGTSATFSSSVTANGYLYINTVVAGTPKAIQSWNVSGPNYGTWYDLGTNDNKVGFGGSTTIGGIPSSPLLVYDFSNNRVGIGTTSPSSILTVLKTVSTNYGAKGNAALSLGTAGSSNEANLINFGYDSESWQPAYLGYVCTSGAGSSNGALVFATRDSTSNVQPTERMRITSGGNVGIGTTAPMTFGGFTNLTIASSTTSNQAALFLVNSNTSIRGSFYTNGSSNLRIGTATSHDFLFDTADTERMRITSGGDVCIASTAPVSTRRELRIGGNAAGSRISMGLNGTNYSAFVTDSGGNVYIANEYNDSAIKLLMINYNNGVYLSQSATSWTSNSDERLKTDLVPIENATEKVNQLRSVIGRYKTDNESKRRPFLIAQDVLEVLPEATNFDSSNGMYGVQYTEVIPLLVASIKELKAELDTLKNK